jgi:hypothetical protein
LDASRADYDRVAPAAGIAGSCQADERRARSEKRLERVREMFEWGDIDAAESRRKAEEARADPATLPEPDKVISFDAVAARVASMPKTLAAATPEQANALIALVV